MRVGGDGAAPGALRLYSANIGDNLKETVKSLSPVHELNPQTDEQINRHRIAEQYTFTVLLWQLIMISSYILVFNKFAQIKNSNKVIFQLSSSLLATVQFNNLCSTLHRNECNEMIW